MHSVSASTTSSSSNDKLVCSADAADRMVKIELEAAEALAGLAQVATRESSESGTRQWRSKGKRAAASRVKSESPSPDIALHSTKKQATMEYDLVEEIDASTRSKKAKDKQETNFVSPSTVCDASTMSYGGCRSRKNLTEAEKEEKRLRRVLANRESARQTIRRRQALHEELSRKASNLSMQNSDLKREKELALEQLRTLKTTNELLKGQVYRSLNPVREENFLEVVQNKKPTVEENLLQMSLNIKPEEEENLQLQLAHPDVLSPKNTSVLYCNNTHIEQSKLTPHSLPSVVLQSSNLDHSAPMTRVVMPATIPTFTPGLNSSQHNPYTIGTALTPVYILPYPWFLPVPHPCEVQHRSPGAGDVKHNGVSSSCNGSFSPDMGMLIENHHSTLHIEAEAEVCESKETTTGTSTSETPFLHKIEGTGAGVFGTHAAGNVCNPSPPKTSSPCHMSSNAKHEQWFSHDTSQLGSQSLFSVPERNTETTFFFPIKMTEHAVAAVEARKRRKELTRFKNFQGRQFQLPC